MSWKFATRRLTQLGQRALNRFLDPAGASTPPSTPKRRERALRPETFRAAEVREPYLGDFVGPLPHPRYEARDDDRPDPGEVVWAWVPYEENYTEGKDRPVLVIARHPQRPDAVLALPLTSKDHDRDAAQEARAGRLWMDIGSGAWDRRGRGSEVRLNRVLSLRDSDVRRAGSRLAPEVFEHVAQALKARDQVRNNTR